MYHITGSRFDEKPPTSWECGDYALVAVDGLISGFKRFPIAFDVQTIDDSYGDGQDFDDFYPPTEFYFSSGEFE